MGRSIRIMEGGSFKRGMNSKAVIFSARRAVQPSSMYKSNWKRQDGSLLFLYTAFLLA